MKVFLSPIAERKIQLLLDYLEQEWSRRSREDFLSILQKRLKQISKQPQSCVKSDQFPNLYKCVVTHQTTLFYRIKLNEIEVVTVIDNRQDPEKIVRELGKLF
jgi:plasmid stabilization system protein ParE